MRRRDFLKTLALTSAAASTGGLWACRRGSRPPVPGDAVTVVAAEGFNYDRMEALLAAGRLPNLAALARRGCFVPLTTTTPAEPETAWATFATGLTPGQHGIFGRWTRDPATYRPCLNDVRAAGGRFLGDYVVWPPTFASRLCGEPFWVRAARAGITTVALWPPSSFPAPAEDNLTLIAGWGTPDGLLSPGTYHYFASHGAMSDRETLAGGVWRKLSFRGHKAHAVVESPPAVGGDPVAVEFDVSRRGVLLIRVGDQLQELQERTFSPYFSFTFGRPPLGRYRAAGRFFVIKAWPEALVYLQPLDLDPRDDRFPLAAPAAWGRELASDGPLTTRGRTADLAALADGVIGNGVFAAQWVTAQNERRRLGLAALERRQPRLAVYASNGAGDIARVFWRYYDDKHPRYNQEHFFSYADLFEKAYEDLDKTVGDLASCPSRANSRFFVICPYGVASARRVFDLNAWLIREGYAVAAEATPQRAPLPVPEAALRQGGYRGRYDWSRTTAWAQGYGQIYLNLRGREKEGRVAACDLKGVKSELRKRLLALRDGGVPPVAAIHDGDDVFAGPRRAFAPDLVVTLRPPYRFAGCNVLGGAQGEVFRDNEDLLSGETAGLEARAVSGFLISDRKEDAGVSQLHQVGPLILAALGVE